MYESTWHSGTSGWRSSTVDAFASPESSNVVNVFSKFHICDVRCLPNAEFAKCQVFLPNAKFCRIRNLPSVKFRRMPNLAACRVFKVPIFLNAEYATCRVFPSAQFFRLLRAEFAKSRVLSNARFCRVTACRRLPAVKS